MYFLDPCLVKHLENLSDASVFNELFKKEEKVKAVQKNLKLETTIQFEEFSRKLFQYMQGEKNVIEFLHDLIQENPWKKEQFLWIEVLKKFGTFYTMEDAVESFIRHKTLLDVGRSGTLTNLKKGDKTKYFLASKAAKLQNQFTPYEVHLQVQNLFKRKENQGKHPRLLELIQKNNRLRKRPVIEIFF